ncbi:hypothetical protein OUZ56_024243 [Daphnia magna]|uniref:Uncharacterized protein n=1 Tax=Daphnia magna TaxID=35525 RepID=A0ABR0B0F6_9CRUS|nr:hypothetical protein OUZ56_024243 [Daphnia magna]
MIMSDIPVRGLMDELNKRFTPCHRYVLFFVQRYNTHREPVFKPYHLASEWSQRKHRRETQLAQQKNVLRNHAQSLFKDSDTEEERRELLRQASTLLHEADPSLTPSNQKRTFFHSQYWHSRIHDIPEDELIFELQHHLEANGRIRLSDEHTRVSLLSLLALYPSLDTPARLFEFLNLGTGYTPVLPRSYDSSDSAPSIDAPTPPLRTDTPAPRQETDKFTPPTSTSSPIASPTMSHHHTLHPTPVSVPPCPTSLKTPSNRKVSFTPVLTVYGAGASRPSPVQASTFFETYEKELTRLLEAGVDTKTAVSTARTLAQAEQNQPMATTDTLQGTTNPYPTSKLQGVTPLPVPQWGYNTPPTNPFAPSGQHSQSPAHPGFVASTPVNPLSSG